MHIWDKYVAWTEHIGCTEVLKDTFEIIEDAATWMWN